MSVARTPPDMDDGRTLPDDGAHEPILFAASRSMGRRGKGLARSNRSRFGTARAHRPHPADERASRPLLLLASPMDAVDRMRPGQTPAKGRTAGAQGLPRG